MSNTKFGSYITKLMTTVIDKGQEEFVIDLAYNELKRLSVDLEEFLRKNTSSNGEESQEEIEKQLLQEDKKNVKDK